MPSDVTALLFFPPQLPFPLPAAATIVLGRSRECDVRLPDIDTSRRHAKIVGKRGGYTLHDLSSTNGTFVNGERVKKRLLQPGDRIQIGANSVTFCEVSSGLDAPDDGDANTVIFERPVAGEVFRGDLAEIPPFAVLQILEMGRKSGLLLIDSDTAPGKLWLVRGHLIHAETKQQVGFDAAVALVHARAGRFVFEPQTTLPEATIDASVTELLMEAARQLDEELC